MKKEENLKKNKYEKDSNSKIPKSPDNNKISSGERIVHKQETDSIKNSKNNMKKLKKKFSNKKRKSIEMFLVLFIFMSLSTICLSISHFTLQSKIEKLFDKNKKLSLAVFIIMLIGSFIFSIFVSCCECLIKTHFLGIIFFIILNVAIDYCVLYISYLSYFEQVFCFLIVLVSGSLGCLLITIFVKADIPNIYILLIFNLIFAIIGIAILFFIYNSTGDIIFSIFALIISEFNVYSSQYQLCSKEKREPMTYSQPFEIIISFFKMLFFLYNILKKLAKIFSKICKKKKEEGDGQDNENVPNDDIEVVVDNNEQNIENNDKKGNIGEKKVKKKK